MKWLKKLHPNIVILIVVAIVVIVLINLNIIKIGGGDKDTVIKEYVTNKKLDSLIQVIQVNQEAIDNYNTKIKDYQKSIKQIDKKLSTNKKELDKITIKHAENITNIKDYSSNELYKYLSDRYTN